MLCAWFPDVNQIVDRRFRFVVAGAKLIENHSQHRFFFSSCRKFSNQYHFYPFSCSCYRRHLFQSELHCFLAPVQASLFPLFHHCLRNHSSYFSTGAQGLGSPLLNVFVGFHNPVVHSRCNLLKSIFHLHTLVLASTVPL